MCEGRRMGDHVARFKTVRQPPPPLELGHHRLSSQFLRRKVKVGGAFGAKCLICSI